MFISMKTHFLLSQTMTTNPLPSPKLLVIVYPSLTHPMTTFRWILNLLFPSYLQILLIPLHPLNNSHLHLQQLFLIFLHPLMIKLPYLLLLLKSLTDKFIDLKGLMILSITISSHMPLYHKPTYIILSNLISIIPHFLPTQIIISWPSPLSLNQQLINRPHNMTVGTKQWSLNYKPHKTTTLEF